MQKVPDIKLDVSRLESIPIELRNICQWLNWRYEYKDGKLTKPPVGSATDIGNMASFQTALENASLNGWGIGYAFTQQDGIVGIDLDHVIQNGLIQERAKKIINHLDSYSEYSPSGSGVHIFVKGTITSPIKQSGIEIYDRDRYFTVTGAHVEGTPRTVNDRSEELKALISEISPKKNKPKQRITEEQTYRNQYGWPLTAIRDKDPVLDRLLKGVDDDYEGDTSRADMATLSKLLYWGYLRSEVATILKQYRHREKLDREDYIERTLEKIQDTPTVARVVDVKHWTPENKNADIPDEVEAIEYGDPITVYREIRKFIQSHVDLVDPAEYDVLTAKVFESWLIGKFNEVGYIFFVGPPKSGKTRAMETMAEICYNPILAAYMTSPVIYRLLDQSDATLFLDELQQYLNDDRSTFMAILNAGQRRGQKAWINVPTGEGYEPRGFEVFGSKVMASTEETVRALATRCVIISMVKNARRVPLRINKKWAKEIRAKLQKYVYDVGDKSPPDLETLFYERGFSDYRNIEAFINLVAVVPSEFRNNILSYAKKIDDLIAIEEGTGFYSDLFAAIEKAHQSSTGGKISVESIKNAYNKMLPPVEQIDSGRVGREINVMGLREKTRMSDGKMGRLVNSRMLDRLRRRYGDAQSQLGWWSEGTEGSEVSEDAEGDGFNGSVANDVSEPQNTPVSTPSVSSVPSEPSENLSHEQAEAIVKDATEFLLKMDRQKAEHGHIEAYLHRRHGVSEKKVREILWGHPDFIRPDAWSLRYYPQDKTASQSREESE